MVDGRPTGPRHLDPLTFEDEADERDYREFLRLIAWIRAEVPRERENVSFVLHTGDVTQNGSRETSNSTKATNIPLPAACLEPPVNGCRCDLSKPRDGVWCLDRGDPTGGFVANSQAMPRGQIGDQCFCWQFAFREDEWVRFDRGWRELEREVPAAIVAGNHDNAGFLEGGGPDDPLARRERPGFAQFFSPSRLDAALSRFPGFERVSSLTVHGNQVGTEPRSGPDGLFRRRGLSHAWRFRLGPYPVGVLGLDWAFLEHHPGRRAAEEPEIQKNLAWANGVLDGALAGLPIVALSHQWVAIFKDPETQVQERWRALTEIAQPIRHRVFHLVEGHHSPTRATLLDRDPSTPQDDAQKLLYTRSPGQFSYKPLGHGPQLIAVRFIFRTLDENVLALGNPGAPPPGGMRDEVEVFTLKPGRGAPTRPGISLLDWDLGLCEDFSIFFDDRDYDGVKDDLDNCPVTANPDQTEVCAKPLSRRDAVRARGS